MKRVVNKIVLLVALSSYCLTGWSQNQQHITQYMIHQPLMNFASIAANDHVNMAALYRNQWVGFDGAPSTGFFSFNSPLGTTNLHVGGMLKYDQIGANRNTGVDLGLAYRVKLSQQNYLSFALKGGIDNTTSDYSGLYFYDDNDPEFTGSSFSVTQPNFGFSSYFFSEDYYIGFAIPAFLRNRAYAATVETFSPTEFHYFTTAGYRFKLSNDFKLGVSTFLKAVVGSPLQADFNGQLLYKDVFGFGLSYRTSNDIAAIATIKLFDRLTFSYSYDLGISDFSRYHNNSHEIMLIYDLPKRNLLPIYSPRF